MDIHPRAIALVFLVIVGTLGVYALSGGPLAHNYILNPDYKVFCDQTVQERIQHLQCGDPITILWNPLLNGSSTIFKHNALSQYLPGGSCATTSPANGCESLNSNTTMGAVALSTKPLPDLGPAYGKELSINLLYTWQNINVNCCNFKFGWFITTNSTLSTTNINYNPYNDPNVQMAMIISLPGGPTAFYDLYIKTPTSNLQTIGQQDSGTGGGSSDFMEASSNPSGLVGGSRNAMALNFLNYSGTGSAGTTNNGASLLTVGPGNNANAKTTVLPPFQLSPGIYYLGLFQTIKTGPPDTTSTFQMIYDTSNSGTPTIQVATPTVIGVAQNCPGNNPCYIPPQNVNPLIDTGGFFGPIVRALIQIGVFIVANAILFFGYLYGLIVPLLAGLATILGSFLEGILNAFGGIFSDPHLGTDIKTAFTQIVAYFAQVFASAVQIWSNILTTLLNFVTFITKFFVGNPFIAFIEAFIAQAPNIWTVLGGVWADIMQYYISGVFTIQTILVFWYLFGMYEVYMHGLSGFKSWLQTSEIGIFGIFKAGYWLIDEAYAFVVQLKQLLFGNTVSPVKVAGTG